MKTDGLYLDGGRMLKSAESKSAPATDTSAKAANEPRFKSALARRQGLFLDATARGDNGLNLTPTERARKTAEDFVASAFIEPLLKQMRENNHAAPPFAPGPAEKQFGGIVDAQMARQIAHASRYDLVEAMTRKLAGKKSLNENSKDVKTAAEQIGAAAKSQGGLNVTAF